MLKRSSIFTYLMYAICVCTLVACSQQEKHKDISQYIAHIKQLETKKQQNTPPKWPVQLPKAALYQAHKLRAPFQANNNTKQDGNRNAQTPLQEYGLNVLRFIGTLTKADTTYAYILMPNGMVYQVQEGDIIGDQNGKVISIQPDRVNVMEVLHDSDKPNMQRIVTLQLKD